MNRALLVSIIALVLFWVPAIFIQPDSMLAIVSAGLFVASIWGVFRWGGAAWRVIRRGATKESDQGILAIVILLIALALQRVYSVVFVTLDRPLYLQNSHVNGFLAYLLLIGCVLLIASTRYEGEKPSQLGATTAGIAAILSVLIAHSGPWLVTKVVGIISALPRL